MPKEKHTTYYNLQDAFLQNGCAFCNVLEKSTIKYFDDLLYEKVNDREINAELSASSGYCHRHAQILVSFKDVMGIAMLYRRIVTQMSDYIVKRPADKLKNEYKIYKIVQEKNCPACKNEKSVNERYFQTFTDYIDDFSYLLKGDKSSPLCMEHFMQLFNLISLIDIFKADKLKSMQCNKLECVSNELETLINSYDYRKNTDKLSAGEKTSWLNAVEIISGRTYKKQKKWKK